MTDTFKVRAQNLNWSHRAQEGIQFGLQTYANLGRVNLTHIVWRDYFQRFQGQFGVIGIGNIFVTE